MRQSVEKLMKRRGGVLLDLGSAIRDKDANTVRMGRRGENDVDIVHSPEVVPYPLPDGCCLAIMARHIVEHISRADRGFIKVMDEWWRILKPSGRLMVASVYGQNYQNDPAACTPITQDVWMHFMPDHPSKLWERYRPKPWKMIAFSFHANGTAEGVFEKISMKGKP